MAPLTPCSFCRRHIRATEAICPFCEQAVVASKARTLGPVLPRRAGRAAFWIFSAATVATPVACGGDSEDTSQRTDPSNQDPNDPSNPGVADASTTPDDPIGEPQPVYGAPVNPDPVVPDDKDAAVDQPVYGAPLDAGAGIDPIEGDAGAGQDAAADSGGISITPVYGVPQPVYGAAFDDGE